MDPTDEEIRKRLDKLKDDRPPVPSEEELRLRLQKLKGDRENPSAALSNKYVLLPCVKSNEEQVDDLMKQYSAEATLQQRFTTPVNDIEERLNNLKMYQFSNSNNDQQKVTNVERSSRSVKQKVEAMTTDEDESVESSSSYPQVGSILFFQDCDDPRVTLIICIFSCKEYFCYICDRVPKWICYTCEDQLFCSACFKEYHEDEDEPHKKKPFNVRRMRMDSDSD